MCGNPLQQSGSWSEPDPEPNQDFGPVANTNYNENSDLDEYSIQQSVTKCNITDITSDIIDTILDSIVIKPG